MPYPGTKFNLPQGMSQLDYLWNNFGGKKISEGNLTNPDTDSIVTEEALNKVLLNYTNGMIARLKLVPSLEDDSKLQLIGISPTGQSLTVVDLDKEDYLQDIEIITATQVEVDKEICDNLDEPILVAKMKGGKVYYVNLSQFKYIGAETKSIKTTVTGNKISANLKIDQSVETPIVDVRLTNDGLKVDLLLKDPEQGQQLKLVRTINGLDTSYTWDNGNNILFQCLTFNEYKLLKDKAPGKIYFIPDAMCIYLDGIRYGDNLSLQDTDTIQIVNNSNVISLEVKLDPDRYNLISKSQAGLTANIFWEE